MKNRIYSLFLSASMMSMAGSAFAQGNTTIWTGEVYDDLGEPIPGATVTVTDTKTGCITDADGKFSIAVPNGKSIHVSYIGFEGVTVTDNKQTHIVLKEDAQQLEDVVVVGYGVQKKAHLTGAVATISQDQITDLSNGNIASSLSGLVNGVSVSGGESRPGENARIYVRNADALSEVGGTAQEPLFVIDGYVYPNDIKVGNSSENLGSVAFNNLDPSTIESITVLKDASAAVYGARAANGVILVTTKKGQQGAPKISYSGQVGITNEVSRPKMLSAYNYGRLFNAVAAADPTNTTLDHKLGLFQADELNAMRGLNYDLLDKYWESALTHKHSVNISGATERANYYASVGYFNQDGNLGKQSYGRWNYRAGIDVQIAKGFKANFSVSGDYGTKEKPLVKVGGTNAEKDYNLLLTHPYYIPESVNGYALASFGPSNKQENNDQTYSFSVLQNLGDYTETVTNNVNLAAGISYDFGELWAPLKGLNARFSYSKSITQSKTNDFGSKYDIYYMNERTGSGSHLYTPVEGQDYSLFATDTNFKKANNGVSIYNGPDGGYLSRSMDRVDNYQMNFTVSYNRDFDKIHHVGALFSIERSEAESEYLQGQVTDPYEFTTGQSNSVGANSTATTVFTRAESGSLSYVGRLNYAYADKYLFEFLFRSDSSTKFSPDNYWGFFPSLSLGWVISKEDWFKENVPFIDHLKVRSSWGLTGRDNTTAWQWKQTYGTDKDKGPVIGYNTNAGSHITLNKNNAAVNPDAHWDKSYKTNYGLDFGVLANRLTFDIEYYHQWDREMLMPYTQSIASTIGTQSAYMNYGEMNSWGWEFGINWRDRIGKDWKYKVGINTGYSDNEVLVMDWKAGQDRYRLIQPGSRSDIGTWGMQCLGMFRSFQEIEEYFNEFNIQTYMGKSKDQVRPGMLIYKDVRGYDSATDTYTGPDGIVDQNLDQVQLSARNNPYGFTTNFQVEWKNLSLGGQLSASWGGYSFIPTSALKPTDLQYTSMPSFWNVDNMYSYQDVTDESGNIVVKENRDAKYPNMAYSSVNSVTSSFWRVSGTRVRLSRLTLAYAVPKDWCKKMHVDNMRLNVTGQNLLSLYNPYPDKFIDPMTSYGSSPVLRKFTIGLNMSF